MDVYPAEYNSAVQFLWYGHRNVPKPGDYEHALKAVKAMAMVDGELSVREQVRLLGKMCAILTPPDVVEAVMKFDGSESPADLLARVDIPSELRPGTAAWIVYEALAVMISDGALTLDELAAAREGAASMGVPGETVDTLAQLCEEEEAVRARRVKLLYSTIATRFRFAHEDEAQVRGRTADLTEILAAARKEAGVDET
jgi:hypothetical protein